MWAFAENQREGRSEADSAALAMIWACEDHSLPYHTVSPIDTLTAYRDSSLDILLRLVATCVGVLYCTVLYCTQGSSTWRRCRGHSSPAGVISTAAWRHLKRPCRLTSSRCSLCSSRNCAMMQRGRADASPASSAYRYSL